MKIIYPTSAIEWGPINLEISSSLDSNITLDLSYFINTTDYYEIIITSTINFFYIVGNINYTFYATIKALDRLEALTLKIKALSLSADKNIPIIDISKNNEDNLLIFENTNTFTNLSTSETTNNSCIFVNLDTKLVIGGNESTTENILITNGGVHGAGIGSSNYLHTGTLNFIGLSTKVISTGGYYSSGIGGGFGGHGGLLTISDSCVITSAGGYYGAGIGGGFHYNSPGNSGTIVIKDNSTVISYGGLGGCGIGGGACFYGDGGNLESLDIDDYSTIYSYGNYVGAGIGGGFGLGGKGGNLDFISMCESATIHSYGGNLGVGIGGGYGGIGGNIGTIIISNNAKVNAYGGLTAGGISAGTSGDLHGTGGNGGLIIIENKAIVNAVAGTNGAGIGGGAGDIGGNGGTINLLDNCSVSSNNCTGYYDNSSGISELNICGGELDTPDLHLNELNLINPNLCGGGGYVVINNPNFKPDLLVENFFKIKLIYPSGTPYTIELFLNNIDTSKEKILVYPNKQGFLSFYVSDGTYYFSTLPKPLNYKTKTFSTPNTSENIITLVVPIYHITRGINLFKD